MTSGSENRAPGRQSARRLLRRLLPAVIVLAGVAAVAVVAWIPAPKRDNPPADRPPVNVEVLVVQALGQVADTIELPGVVEPNRVVKVPAEVSGRIERIASVEGRSVRAGGVMMLLNTDLLKAEFEQAKAMAEFDEREHQRYVEPLSRGAAAPGEVDQVRARAAASAAVLDEAKARLDRATILAPVGGILDDLPVEVGEYVSPGQTVGEIVEIDTAKVVVDVPERDVSFLRRGQRADVLVEARGETYGRSGTIGYISELADDKTRTSRVEVIVDNRPLPEWWWKLQQYVAEREGGAWDMVGAAGARVQALLWGDPAGSGSASGGLPGVLGLPRRMLEASLGGQRLFRAGQIVRVRLSRRTLNKVIMIPLGTVVPLESGKAVYVVRDGKAERRDVELGLLKGRSVRVLSGLAGGDRLILSPRLVGPGQPVRVVAE